MPFQIQRPCKSPGCSALVPAGQGTYCPAHSRSVQRSAFSSQRLADRARGTAAERGYDHRWQQARAAFLARYPLCPGVLIATEHWTMELAQQFHQLREQEREAGKLLIFKHRVHGEHRAQSSAASESSVLIFLEQFPIYRTQPWDVARPATVVDHIVPHKGDPDLLWAEWNWQPLTKRAHDKKTAREAKQRGVLNAEC